MAVTDEAILRIKEMIVSGELRPGDRLPKEADLAAHLGLSRNSLREAVRALSLIHILDVRQGDGTYVTSLEPRLLLEAMTFVVDFHRDDTVLDFLEVRRILEPSAAALAAVHMTDEEIGRLGTLLEEVNPDSSLDALIENDIEFHRRIAGAAGNAVLASLIDSLSLPTSRARTWRGLTQDGVQRRTLAEHRAIHDGLATRQPEVARAWATVHVAGVEQWLRASL